MVLVHHGFGSPIPCLAHVMGLSIGDCAISTKVGMGLLTVHLARHHNKSIWQVACSPSVMYMKGGDLKGDDFIAKHHCKAFTTFQTPLVMNDHEMTADRRWKTSDQQQGMLSFRSKDSFNGHVIPSYKRCQNHCAESSLHKGDRQAQCIFPTAYDW